MLRRDPPKIAFRQHRPIADDRSLGEIDTKDAPILF
jgi:hypothetical protein